jgi:AraC family transcriptional regulator
LLSTKEFIDRNLHLPLRLKDMADIAFISEYHFVRLFKGSFGITPHRYHLKKRLGYAAELLLNNSFAIEEVAFKCGFSNISTFSKAFKKHFVIPPSLYKLNNSTNLLSA